MYIRNSLLVVILFTFLAIPTFADDDYDTIRGILVYKELPRTKSVEAYLGEEFFLQVNDGTELVLWPSETVSRDELLSLAGKEVEIMVEWVEGKVPKDLRGSYPVDFYGNPLPRGEGYRVLFIMVID